MSVQTIPSIEEMTGEQKAELLEALWKNMRHEVENSPIPDWHLQILEERERALAHGGDEFVAWDDAKEYIRRNTIGKNKRG